MNKHNIIISFKGVSTEYGEVNGYGPTISIPVFLSTAEILKLKDHISAYDYQDITIQHNFAMMNKEVNNGKAL